MKLLSTLVAVSALAVSSTSALLFSPQINTTIPLTPSDLLSISHSTLSPPSLVAPSSPTSYFLSLPPSSEPYILRLHALHTTFLPVSILVHPPPSPDLEETYEARSYLPGPDGEVLAKGPSLAKPFVWKEEGRKEYFDKAGPFDPIKVIKGNPLILVLVFGGLLSVGMPYILKHLDPEILEEVSQNQREMHQKFASFQNVDMASGLSKVLSRNSNPGSGASTPATIEDAPVAAATAGGGGKSSGKARKRK